MLRDSIQAGLDNRDEAMEYAMQFGRGLDTELADRFVGMYVNELTCDYGDEGRQAVRELLQRAEALGTYEQPVQGRVRRLALARVSRAVVLSAVRTPVGRYGGALAGERPDDLAALVIGEAVSRAGRGRRARSRTSTSARPTRPGEDNRNVARMAALLAGCPSRSRA